MRMPAAVFTIALALGAIILAPRGAQARDAREGPTEITACQTISQPGSYKLVANLTFTGPSNGTCLPITADFVTIDLAGFTISSSTSNGATAIAAGDNIDGITVRNGSISRFFSGVVLRGSGSIVEGLQVIPRAFSVIGIAATGIVKGNIVVGISAGPAEGTGIAATGS